MDKSQADAIAQAILAPDLNKQEALRQKRAKEDRWQLEKRKVAWLGLLGFVIGVAAAHFSGERFGTGGLWGGIAGAAIG